MMGLTKQNFIASTRLVLDPTSFCTGIFFSILGIFKSKSS